MRTAWAGGIAIMGVALGVARSAPAHASFFSGTEGDHDASAYWIDINTVNVTGTVDKARELGTFICSQLRRGRIESDIIASGSGGDPSNIVQTRFVVHSAEWHFCPEYYS
jgi:hypothetical protein